MKIKGNFERFEYFGFKTDFPENESLFKKAGSFPYKTAVSEANVKTNRMVSTKWTYHKKGSFASNYFIFFKVLSQF